MDTNHDRIAESRVNPWTSVWLHPRKTVRYVVDNKPGSFILMIAALAGIVHFLDQAMSNDLGDSWNMGLILLVSLLAGPVFGLIGLFVASGIYYVISMMLGGSGTFTDTKNAYAVSSIILVVGGLIWIPDLLILGQGNFMSEPDLSVGQVVWLLLSMLVNLAVGGWSLFVLGAAIAEVHQLSIWKAVFVVLLPIILLILFLVVILALTMPFL